MPETSGPAPADPMTNEARLEAVLESISDGFYALDAEWRFIIFNKAAEEYFGVSARDILGHSIWDIFPQGRGMPFEWSCSAAMYEGVTTTFETPSVLRPDRFLEMRIAPMRGGGIALSFSDVTERRRAQDGLTAALARSEEVLESITDAFYAVDPEWRFTYVNRIAESWWGKRREELIGQVIWKVFPVAVNGPSYQAHMTAASTREVTRLETFSPVIDRWVDVSIFPSGQGLSVYFRDITERKDAEDRQQLLVHELNHRVKNTLATVQSIAAQTFRGGGTLEEVGQRFTGRLMALASANDVLLERDWGGATLHAIAELVASPHVGEADAERFVVEGPEVDLSPKAATALALGLHELATNAAKYGALSTPHGRVHVSWSVDGEGEDRTFNLTWRESGGPPVKEPDRVGFGTRLLTKGFAYELKAKVTLEFLPDGVVCRATAPAPAD